VLCSVVVGNISDLKGAVAAAGNHPPPPAATPNQAKAAAAADTDGGAKGAKEEYPPKWDMRDYATCALGSKDRRNTQEEAGWCRRGRRPAGAADQQLSMPHLFFCLFWLCPRSGVCPLGSWVCPRAI
jgi:hypothetical protein